jgi:NAD(P)-dependent dehydrogenase (short-subunit alcohol dehydrogenase family)
MDRKWTKFFVEHKHKHKQLAGGEGPRNSEKARKSAIVIGASSGIGRETAKALAARGYQLGLVARKEDLLDGSCSGCLHLCTNSPARDTGTKTADYFLATVSFASTSEATIE